VGILQRIIIFVFVTWFGAGYMGNPIFPWNSKFNEAKFVEAINESDVASLEDMCSKRLKDAYPDLTAQLAEFLALTDGLMEEKLVKGAYDDYFGIIAIILRGIDRLTGTHTPWGSYYCSSGSSGSEGGLDYWNYWLYFGNVDWDAGGEPRGDYYITATWAHMPGNDKGLTRLMLSRSPTDGGEREILFEISAKVLWFL